MSAYFKHLIELIGLSRPEWCFLFGIVAVMFGLFYSFPVVSILIGGCSVFLFTAGHFALNGYYDRYSDKLNPRTFSLRNPMAYSLNIKKKNIFIWILVIWVSVIPLNFIFIPKSFIFKKLFLALLAYTMGILGSLCYSIPPIRFKSRPFLDLLITMFIIGFFVPFYISLLGPEIYIPPEKLILAIGFGLLLISGIHLPTILIDLDTDEQIGDLTTAVYLGWKRASILTSSIIILRVIGLTVINLLLMSQGILVVSISPFILGILEIIVSIQLLKKQNREAAVQLLKTVIITSSAGSIFFAYLYVPVLLTINT